MNDTPDKEKLNLIGPVTEDTHQETDEVGQTIGMEARIMLKSVRISHDGQLTKHEKRQIRETIKAHLEKYKITFHELSLQINYSEPTISEVLKGVYRADDSPILRKLNSWIDDDERRRCKARPIGFYPTSVFETIKGLAVRAKSNARILRSQRKGGIEQESSRISLGWGPAGCGKSIGARALHSEETASILIRVQQRQGTDIGLANLICEAGGWRGTPRGRNLIRFITEKLNNTARLLIVDEGHRLKPSGCELLRDLADVAGIPILILATEEFYERVTKARTGSGNKYLDQFCSRVCCYRDLIRGVDGRGGVTRPIFSIDEVKAIFQDTKVRISPDSIDFLQAVTCLVGLGMMRLANNIFDIALRSALRGNKVMDVIKLRKSAKNVLIPVGVLDHGILDQIDMTLKHNREIRVKAG